MLTPMASNPVMF